MTAYLYTYDKAAQKWALNDVLDDEAAAREKGRRLWRAGVPGIRVDVIQTVVQEIRKGD